MYMVSHKSNPLKTEAYFCHSIHTKLFAIHILTYVPILVHLSQYLWELFCNIDSWILTVYLVYCSSYKLFLEPTYYINEIIQ